MKQQLACPECQSTNLVKQGVIWSGRVKVQQYRCKNCGRNTIHPVNASENEQELVPKPT
jgi:transposase-like protein